MKTEPLSILSIVATPIGNIGDLSSRAKQVLSDADIVLCEDTRVTGNLLNLLEISAPMKPLQQHTDDAEIQRILADYEGKHIALVSDAGTPNVSDPGGKFVQMSVVAGFIVSPIPGPSAMAAALSICGFPADRFTFLGFPPHKKGRARYFEELSEVEHSIVLFESKHRILKTLAELPQNRLMMVARELTKLHETIYRGTAPNITAQIEAGSSKGEFVIVLAPSTWN